MSGLTLFLGGAILSIILILLVKFGSPKKIIKYFSTKEGKGVLVGIVLFLGIGGAIALFSPKAEAKELKWFAYSEVFLGLDQTKKISPMCRKGDISDRLTSNGGLRFNILQSGDRRGEFNILYTHHSCALNGDAKSYDALGFQFTYKIHTR